MSLLTSDGATLRAFADSVLRAAEEIIDEVVPVVLAVIGGVLAEAEPGSDELTRYAVSFEAPEGALVPVLVGWEPPAEADEDGAA